jgi:hypothetical protein
VQPEITGGNADVTVTKATLQTYNGTTPVDAKFGAPGSGAAGGSTWTGGASGNAPTGVYLPTPGTLLASAKLTMPQIVIEPKTNSPFNKVMVTFSWTRTVAGKTETGSVVAEVAAV